MHSTDYKNLNWFEAGLVIFIALGILLIGAILFMNLNPKQQDNFVSALNMFDLHQQVAHSAGDFQVVWAMPHQFFQEFYKAFGEVAVMPAGHIEYFENLSRQTAFLYSDFLHYSDQVTFDYYLANQPAPVSSGGQVAGVAIERAAPVAPEPEHLFYQPPKVDWRQAEKFLININH